MLRSNAIKCPQIAWLQLQANTNEFKKNRDPERFAAFASELAGVKNLSKNAGCQLIYYDEAGFCASPPVQRAWSKIGQTHEVTPAHHQRVTVMGALDFGAQHLHHQQVTGSVNREIFVAFMNDLIPKIAKPEPTFIVLDNARIHHNLDEVITARWLLEFKTVLCYLPPYSRELNMIEILWKQAKYFWRKFETWNKDSFKEKIGEMLDGFDSKFQINFL